MQWSVTLQARGDRELTHDEIVELADAVAARERRRLRHRHDGLRRAAARRGRRRRRRAIELGSRLFTAAAARAGLPPWPISAVDAVSEVEDGRAARDPPRLARRLSVRGAAGAGRLDGAGDPGGVRGPLPSPSPTNRVVRRHLRRPQRRPLDRGLPVPPPRGVVLGRAGRQQVEASSSATYEVPGGMAAHRELIVRELCAIYHPAATSSSSTTRGRTTGSASTTRPPPAPLTPAGSRAPHAIYQKTVRTTPAPDPAVRPGCRHSRSGAYPTMSCIRDRRVPEAGAAGDRGGGGW